MKLEDINKDNIFKVPDNYFENFPERLRKRIEETEPQKKVTSMNTWVARRFMSLFFSQYA